MIKPPAHTDRSASALAEMPLERLEGELESMAAHMASAMARWLELVAEFDRREGWTQWGSLSCADWLAWRCALAPRTAREQLRVARRLRELPAVRSAFASGELSYSKARVLSRVAEEATEPELLELARLATGRAARDSRAIGGARQHGGCRASRPGAHPRGSPQRARH